jgi:Divergent polysaccharide deacetylase
VTVAVDPLRADARETAAAYRAAGSEVALLVDSLPTGATPADLEVAYQSYIQTLPEAVALVGNPQASFLRSSTEAQHVSALLAADGRGLVTYQAGLNLARRAAEKAGAPVVTIEKYFGPAGADTMARELDRAAFSAARSGSAVIALPATPEMLSALAAWASGPSGAAVSLAPVSALMLPEQNAVATPPEEATGLEPAGDENNLPGQKVGTFSDSN